MILHDKEYVLLRNYLENIVSRGFLLRIPFVALEQIEKNSWHIQIPDDEKLRVRSLIQIDIVSKIMMYVEDLAILAESFHLNRDFYELLMDENVDIGDKTGKFINEVDSFTHKKLLQIMSYLDTDQISLDEKWRGLLKKHFDYHIEKVRRILQEIASFSKANHLIYKRFKHAGMPIFVNSVPNPPSSLPLDKFEAFNVVAQGSNPVEDSVIIPYSKSVMKRYEKIINELPTLLQELTQNRIECLKRNISGVIPLRYPAGLFSSPEAELMQTKIDEFYRTHPSGDVPTKLNYNINTQDSKKIMEKIRWYLKEED